MVRVRGLVWVALLALVSQIAWANIADALGAPVLTVGSAAMVKVLLTDTPVMANRVLTFGRLVWADFLEHQLVEENPFVGVKRNRTTPRTRNYTWEEWNAIRAAARPLMQLVMDGLFLTDQRIGDLLKIDERDLLEQGIYVKQQKTGKELIIGHG